jgi:hypothetical protein
MLTLTGQDITFTSSQGFQETICIKALTDTVTNSPLPLKHKGELVTVSVKAFMHIVSWKPWEEVKVMSCPVNVSMS